MPDVPRSIVSIAEPTATIAILDRLGLSHETPPLARARDPTDDDARDEDTCELRPRLADASSS